MAGTSSNSIVIWAETIGGESIDLSSTIAITTSSYVTYGISTTHHLVEYNLFENYYGENEIITVKTDTNVWEGNISYNETYADDSSYVYAYEDPNLALSDDQ